MDIDSLTLPQTMLVVPQSGRGATMSPLMVTWTFSQLWTHPSLVQTITSEFLKWTGRCCLYPIAGSAVLLLLAGNCLPYHQPKFLTTKDSKKALGLSRFLFTLPGWYPLGVPKPTTLVDSQLHQMHLMHPT